MTAAAVLTIQGGMPVVTAPGDLPVPQPADMAALADRLAAAEAAITALKARPLLVPLAGALPVATLQAGRFDVAVPVAGLLRSDTAAVEVEADLPAGLMLGMMRPDRTRDGVLLVQTVASLAVPLGAAPIPLRVTAVRAP